MRLRLLRQQRGSAPGTVGAKSLLDAAEGELLLSNGRPDLARQIAMRSAKHSMVTRLVLARAELKLEHFSAAAVQAQKVLQASSSTTRSRLEAELVLACVVLRTGQYGDAEQIAKRISEYIRTTGMRAPLRRIAGPYREPLADLLRTVGVEEIVVSVIGAEQSPYDTTTPPVVTLTSRERATLQAFTELQTVDEVAQHLFVSRNTVKSQLTSAYRKLNVSSRKDALTRAAVLGLIHEGDGEITVP